jgi:hypothetical protein
VRRGGTERRDDDERTTLIAPFVVLGPGTQKGVENNLGLNHNAPASFLAWVIPFGSMDCLLASGRDGMGYRVARRCHKDRGGVWIPFARSSGRAAAGKAVQFCEFNAARFLRISAAIKGRWPVGPCRCRPAGSFEHHSLR